MPFCEESCSTPKLYSALCKWSSKGKFKILNMGKYMVIIFNNHTKNRFEIEAV